MRIPGYFIWLPLLLLGFSAHADIYRCSGELGEPSFRQHPCSDNSTVAIQQPPADPGQAAGLRPSERAWLQQRERDSRRVRTKDRRARVSPAAARKAARTQAYRCKSKRRALDALRAKMRRGYKPANGEKLRRRQGAYDDYLDAFCS